MIGGLLTLVWLDAWLDTVTLSDFWSKVFRGRTDLPAGIVMFGLTLVVAPLAGRELANIFRANGIAARTWLTSLAAMAGVMLSYSIPTQTLASAGTDATTTVAIVATGMLFVFILALFTFSRNQNVQGVVAAAGAVVFAMVYLGFMLGFFLALRRSHSAWLIIGIIFTTKMCDTGAYFTGRLIGKRKLIPWLSPGKTWEGLAGGIVTAAGLAMLLAWWARGSLDPPDNNIPLWFAALAGALFAVVGQLGDLAMSLFKRDAGIKDSSSILPGLGGVLDVLDSPLMVAPIAYWMFELWLAGIT